MAEGGGFLGAACDVVFDFFCELCIDDGKRIQAEGFCVDCAEYICGTCYSDHRNTRFRRNHVLQDQSSMPKDETLSPGMETRDIAIARLNRINRFIDVYHTSPKSNTLVTKLGGINVKTDGDNHATFINGLAAITNKLVIADSHNNKLKLVNTDTNKVLGAASLPSSPWDIARINDELAAVTVPAYKKILIVKVTNVITKTREIIVRGECCGVAYSQRRLFVTFRDRPRLEILELHGGKVIRTIDKHEDGRKMFAMPGYVCTSSDGTILYVSDSNIGAVISMNLDGEVKAVYQDDELVLPHKVCIDGQGNIYVCGYYIGNVHLVTPKCRKLGVLTKACELRKGVRSICYCRDKNRLYTGVDTGVLKAYQLTTEPLVKSKKS